MSVTQSVADILNHHVTFQLEWIDRMYLNCLRADAAVRERSRPPRPLAAATTRLAAPRQPHTAVHKLPQKCEYSNKSSV
jgi:uncharacterized damage-inducible protein DinB